MFSPLLGRTETQQKSARKKKHFFAHVLYDKKYSRPSPPELKDTLERVGGDLKRYIIIKVIFD